MRLPVLLRLVLGLAATSTCIAAPLAAQVRSFELTSDNDAYNFWIPFAVRPDYEYSNGLRLAAELEGAPGWAGLAKDLAPCAREGSEETPADPEAGCVSTTFEFGQRLYMPRNDSYLAIAGERPFAGWLYVAATGRVVEGSVRHTYGIEAGVTGEPSLGRAVMESFHEATGFRNVVGWRHQLGFEPGVVLRYGAEQRAELRAGKGRIADVVADVGATLGNVHTGAQAGGRARVGYDLRHPWAARAEGHLGVPERHGIRTGGAAQPVFGRQHPGKPAPARAPRAPGRQPRLGRRRGERPVRRGVPGARPHP